MPSTIVNVQDPVSLNYLSVDASGRIGINNWPATQTVSGTVSIAAFPAVQQVSGTVDVTDRALRQLGIVSISSGGVGTNTAPGYTILQDGTTTANKLKVNSDGSINANLNTETITIGTVELVDSGGTNKASISAAGAVKVDGSAVTQPVSHAALGTMQFDGSNNLKVVQQGTVAVTGTFWQATQPVSGTVTANAGSGSFTVAQATASNLNAQVQGAAASGATQAGNPLKVGGVFNTTQPTVTNGQAVDAQMTARGAQIVATGTDSFTVRTQGTSDGGVTFQTVKTASDGTLATNANLQAGTVLAGAMMSYREMVARALVGNARILTGTQALVNNGGSAAAAITLNDQNGNAYTTVTNGKTLYIAFIDVTLDSGGTTAAPLTQTATITISDGTNTKYKFVASNGGSAREPAVLPTLASATTLTVKASPSNLATAVGNVVVTLAVWEE